MFESVNTNDFYSALGIEDDSLSDTFFGNGDDDVDMLFAIVNALLGSLQEAGDGYSQGAPARRDGANPIPENVRYRDEICTAAKTHGLDPMLLAAVAAQETGGPGSNSGRNVQGADGTGHGVFQIDSGTWQTWLSSHHGGMDVAENADKAAAILADNLKGTGGDVKRALHWYNAGSDARQTTHTTWGDGQRLDYETSVLRHKQLLQSAQR